MLRRLWLVFAQTATVAVALLFVLTTLRPDLLPGAAGSRGDGVVTLQQVEPRPAATPAGAQQPANAAHVASYSEAAKRAMPAVVNIYTSKEVRFRHPMVDDPLFRRFFEDQMPQSQRQTSLGSGVIVSPQGYVLTNHHVVDGADDIQVQLADGRRFAAKVRGTDPDTDLAVLKAEGNDLPAMTLGNPDGVQVGDVVLAIGNPFGLGSTVTLGIVSALGRNQLGINRLEDYIQTDAAINPGNSGGALVDADGHLIGIPSSIFSRTGGSMGIGFAVPVSIARSVMEQIIAGGEVSRGWLGVELQEMTPELAESFGLKKATGVVVVRALPGGPAERSGVRGSDIIVEVAGKRVDDRPSLLLRVASIAPGTKVPLKVLREGAEKTLDIEVGKRPKNVR
jgi:serine protease DegQ